MMKPSTQYGSHDSMAATASTVMQMFLFLSSHTAITHSAWCVGWQWSSMGATQTIINIVTKALLQMKKKNKNKNVRAQTRVFVTTSIHSLNTCNRDDKTLESNDLYTLLFVFPSNMEKKTLCNCCYTSGYYSMEAAFYTNWWCCNKWALMTSSPPLFSKDFTRVQSCQSKPPVVKYTITRKRSMNIN